MQTHCCKRSGLPCNLPTERQVANTIQMSMNYDSEVSFKLDCNQIKSKNFVGLKFKFWQIFFNDD